MWNFALSAVRRIPLNVYRNRNAAFAREVARAAPQYPMVVVDHYEMYQYLPKGYTGKTVLVEHNVEFDLWERYAAVVESPMIRLLVRWEAKRIRRYEQAALRAVSAAICFSSNDAERARQLAETARVYAVPLIGDISLLRVDPPIFAKTAPVVLYVGTLSWEPNIDGLHVFLEKAWGQVLRAMPQVRLHIVGKNPDKRILRAAARQPNVHVRGHLTQQELEAEYSVARVAIAPQRFGGGVKVKVVNAMMRGLPVVATPVAMEGIADTREYGGIARTIEDMPSVLLSVLSDGAMWHSLSEQGRRLAEQRFGDAAVMSALTPVIRALST